MPRSTGNFNYEKAVYALWRWLTNDGADDPATTAPPVNTSAIADDYTQGSMVFANADGDLVEDNANLFYDDGNDRVGIRTNTPSAALEFGAATASEGGILFGGDTNLYRSAADTLKTDDAVVAGSSLEVDGDLDHDGSNVGFFGVAPVARPSALTQTFSTADRTHAGRTAESLTDNSGGTADNTVAAVSGSGDDSTINDNFADLVDEINKLRDDQRDTAEFVNAIADDLQSLGLEQ